MDEQQPTSGNLSADAAALYLGGHPITATTVIGLARKKKIGHLKIGRATVFPITALDAYIAAHTIQPVENDWGLTDSAIATLRGERPARVRRAS